MKIEICANSYRSAINAQKAGADRIELCSELAVGGITPSYGLLKRVMDDLTIPVNVLIRPRSGNFTYDDAEFDAIKSDIELCKKLGCNGIVAGILNKDFTIDINRTKALINLSRPLSFTFHRAFDWILNPRTAIEQLANLGVDRVLSSGQESTALKGITLLEQLQEQIENRLIILPGCGINKGTILQFKHAKFKEVHFSATALYKTIEAPKVSMHTERFFDETQVAISDFDKIKEMINLVK